MIKESKFYYTPYEVAKMLKLNKITIYRKIKAKKLKAYKIGKEFRIEKTDLGKFLYNSLVK